MQSTDAPRVVVADDDALARRVLVQTLREAGIAVVGEAADGAAAVAAVERCRPDVVVMDLAMPELDGIAATRAIKERRPETVVIVLTGSRRDEAALVSLRA